MSSRPQKRARYGEAKGKSAYLKSQKAMAVRLVPRPLIPARAYRGPLPNSMEARLIYTKSLLINAGAGAWGGNVFGANNVVTCDITGAAGQPRGRDEMFALYNHCFVKKAIIEVRYAGNLEDTLVWGIAVRDDTDAFTDLRDFTEYRNSKYRMCGFAPTNEQVLYHVVEPHKFLGMKDPFDASLRQANATAPEEGVYFHVGCADSALADPGGARFIVKITYFCHFTEPVPIEAS